MMMEAGLTALGVTGAALLTALCSVLVYALGRRSALRNEHLGRAFEEHLSDYEHVFVSARTVQDSLHNYMALSRRVLDRSDPFLFQLLTIAADSAHQYCVAVSWTHSPGMVYLAADLEKCLRSRDLLIEWLSKQRVRSGNVASVRSGGKTSAIPLRRVQALRLGEYQELRIETRRLVISADGDERMYTEINRALSEVIKQLKDVMAY